MDKDPITILYQQLISLYTFSMALPDRNNMFPYHTLLHGQDRNDLSHTHPLSLYFLKSKIPLIIRCTPDLVVRFQRKKIVHYNKNKKCSNTGLLFTNK